MYKETDCIKINTTLFLDVCYNQFIKESQVLTIELRKRGLKNEH